MAPYNAFLFRPYDGLQADSFSLNGIGYVWPVRDGQVALTVSQRLALLLAEATGVGSGKSLADKVTLAQTYYAVPDVQATCAVLTDFVNEVKAQAGKKKLTATQAAMLASDANAIMTAIGCR